MALTHKTTPFLVPKPLENPRLRLFCFPFAGGSGNTYMQWHKQLSSEVELVLVQPPGRGGRMMETPFASMAQVVQELMQHTAYFSEVPYVFFGHSMGSRIAYELAYQLAHSGESKLEYLIASASRAPHLPGKKTRLDDLPEEDFIALLRRLNGTPKEVLENKDLLNVFMPLLRADFKLVHDYQARQTKLSCPIMALHGRQDHGINVQHVRAWQELTDAGFQLVEMQGGHFFINTHKNDVLTQVQLVINEVLLTKVIP